MKKLSVPRIGFLYVGVLMGAGFASGKEIWQFFGVFGAKGLLGLLCVTVIFMLIGWMVTYIAQAQNTNDMSKIVFPCENQVVQRILTGIIVLFLFIGFASMIAAGGSLAEESYGIPSALGTALLACCTVFLTIKGFSQLSASLGKVVPILLLATFLMVLYLLGSRPEDLTFQVSEGVSPFASHWFVAAIVFVSYNMMGAVPILGSCAIYAEKKALAGRGALLGGLMLGTAAVLLYLVGRLDPALTNESPLPMLTFSAQMGSVVGKTYGMALLLAIFSTASSCFYGASTKLSAGKYRIPSICLMAVLGYGFSRMGFANIVAFLYPIEGYTCFLFLLLLVGNYVRIKRRKQT